MLCADEGFSQDDADLICQRVGLESSRNFSSLTINLGNETFWATGYANGSYNFSTNCSTGSVQTVNCNEFECSSKKIPDALEENKKTGTPSDVRSLVTIKFIYENVSSFTRFVDIN